MRNVLLALLTALLLASCQSSSYRMTRPVPLDEREIYVTASDNSYEWDLVDTFAMWVRGEHLLPGGVSAPGTGLHYHVVVTGTTSRGYPESATVVIRHNGTRLGMTFLRNPHGLLPSMFARELAEAARRAGHPERRGPTSSMGAF